MRAGTLRRVNLELIATSHNGPGYALVLITRIIVFSIREYGLHVSVVHKMLHRDRAIGWCGGVCAMLVSTAWNLGAGVGGLGNVTEVPAAHAGPASTSRPRLRRHRSRPALGLPGPRAVPVSLAG